MFSGNGAGVFPKGQGGAALLGLWIRAAVPPLTRKHARRILVAPDSGVRPFSEWLVGPLSVGGKVASALPPILGPKPPALPRAFLQGLETTGIASS